MYPGHRSWPGVTIAAASPGRAGRRSGVRQNRLDLRSDDGFNGIMHHDLSILHGGALVRSAPSSSPWQRCRTQASAIVAALRRNTGPGSSPGGMDTEYRRRARSSDCRRRKRYCGFRPAGCRRRVVPGCDVHRRTLRARFCRSLQGVLTSPAQAAS
jgi:hypothetical protein